MICMFKKLQMKQQALIIQGTIILLALLFISIFVVPITSYGMKIIKKSSHEALINSNDARVTSMSYKIQKLINQSFLQANLTLDKAQQLYLKNITSQYILTSSYKKTAQKGYILAYQQPYNYENINSTNPYFQKFGNFIQLIDSYLLSFNLEYSSNIQLVYRIEQPHITSIFSPITLFSTYDIEQKQYYIEHLNQNNTRLVGSPFVSSTTQKVSFMISQTLYDCNNNKDIIMVLGFQFDNLSKYLTLNNIKFVLCTLNGIIVSSNINTQQIQSFKELTYIYNQTIFPFNKDDWDQMNRYLQNKTYQSNCKQSFIKFCRNIDGNDVQLSASFVQSNFIQIIFNDLSFTKLEDQLLQTNINELIIKTSKLGGFLLIWCFVLLIISSIIITYIIKPLAQMINAVKFQIQTSSLDYIDYVEENGNQPMNIITSLQKSFIMFIDRHVNYRNEKIQFFNQQHYPRFNIYIQLNKKGVHQLKDKRLFINQINTSLRLSSQKITQPSSNKIILERIEQIIINI